jgi:MFS family permease
MMHLRHFKWVAVVGLSTSLAALLTLVIWPAAPLAVAIAMLGIVGTGVGTLYPIATVSVQSAVERYQVGTATGLMNFFRSLMSALLIAVMGAIMLAGMGVAPQRGSHAESLLTGVGATVTDFANMFRWVFASAAIALFVGLLALILMRELPLRGRGEVAGAAP